MTPQLLVLILLTLLGAWRSAKWEAREMSLQRKIHHWLLVMVRAAAALLLIRLILQPQDHWEYLPPLVMSAGVFGPLHRILLWWYRVNHYPKQNRNLEWHHLGQAYYDSFWEILWMGNERAAFISMTVFELIIAAVAFDQSQQ